MPGLADSCWTKINAPGSEARDRLWCFCVATSLAAHRLAIEGGDPDPDAVGRAGLLHPLALWALAVVAPDRLSEWMSNTDEGDRTLLESRWFGRNAASFGFHLARRWGCPPEMSDAILLAGLRSDAPASAIHDPVHLRWVRLGRSWAMRTPWALPGPCFEPAPTDLQRRWLVATVQARCSGGLSPNDDPIQLQTSLRESIAQRMRADHLDLELAELSERFHAVLAQCVAPATEPLPLPSRSTLDAMAEFAAGAAHELNNPLAIIAGRAQLLQARTDDPEFRNALQTIITQARRAHQILRDLIYIARPPVPRDVPCVPDQVLRGVVEDLKAEAENRKVHLCCRTPDPGPTVSTDPEALRHLAEAVIRNALEATTEGGRVLVESLGDRRSVVWTVQDQGIGLDEERSTHLLDPFYCGRQAGRGLGLGLPRVARFLQSVGGSITWEETNHGETITRIKLPIEREFHADTISQRDQKLRDAS
ncbi:histidine kinase dimerization/phospho-acceptor domain-containing protein [Tautonia rosea]|uniref:histidine kinase dimerization/phospho-acceptor domain-containing protein n=1 Tax=Tautonia rosea TaxID=2728037 RepID=UPI001475F681|nr:histidine kinase dimerization/phospho-acceptor domain-containing protein [Tautonia rosea]